MKRYIVIEKTAVEEYITVIFCSAHDDLEDAFLATDDYGGGNCVLDTAIPNHEGYGDIDSSPRSDYKWRKRQGQE
jgi:hypothetical protein